MTTLGWLAVSLLVGLSGAVIGMVVGHGQRRAIQKRTPTDADGPI